MSAPNEFVPRIQSTAYPSRRRAVLWQGRLMRPRNEVETLLFGRPPQSGAATTYLNAAKPASPAYPASTATDLRRSSLSKS